MVLWQHLQRHWQFILIIKTQKEILPLACTKQWDIALVGWLNTMKEIWRKAESGDSLQDWNFHFAAHITGFLISFPSESIITYW